MSNLFNQKALTSHKVQSFQLSSTNNWATGVTFPRYSNMGRIGSMDVIMANNGSTDRFLIAASTGDENPGSLYAAPFFTSDINAPGTVNAGKKIHGGPQPGFVNLDGNTNGTLNNAVLTFLVSDPPARVAVSTFTDNSTPGSAIWFPQSTDSPIYLDDGLGGAYFPRVALSNNNNAVAVWIQVDKVYSSLFSVGTTALAIGVTGTQIISSGATATFANVCVDKTTGEAIAVWAVNDEIEYATINIDDAIPVWSSPSSLPGSGPAPSFPKIIINDSGVATAAWLINDGATRVQSATLEGPTASWSTPEIISITGAVVTSGIELTESSTGDITAVWQDVESSTQRLISAYKPSGQAWNEAEVALTNVPDPSDPPFTGLQAPSVTFFEDGGTTTAWVLTAARRKFGYVVENSDPAIGPTGSTGSTGPTGCTGSTGPLPSTTPPSNVLGMRKIIRFPLQTDYVNIISWDPPDISKNAYFIFRNGTFINSVPSAKLSYEDHNRPKNSTDTYELIAVNTEHEVSSSVFITINP